MPKTDRHSIKVTVGCQCNKCLQSHKAMEEVVPACWWALWGFFIKKFNQNCFNGGVFVARLCLDFSNEINGVCLEFARVLQSRRDFCPLCAYKSYFLPRKDVGYAKAPWLFHLIVMWTRQCGPSVLKLLAWPQLTLKLLFKKSGMKLHPLLAGQYQLTAMGLWAITAVDTRNRDL